MTTKKKTAGIEKTILKKVLIKEIKPYSKNYLSHDKNVDHIVNSITQFGYVKPIVVDETKTILAGHGTLLALKKLEWETVPEVVQVSGFNAKQKKAYRIADNTTAEGAEINIENLISELDAIGASFIMEDFGANFNISDKMLDETPEYDLNDDEDEPTPKGTTKNNRPFVKCPKCGKRFKVPADKE